MEERYRKALSLAAAMLGRRSLSESQLRQKLLDKQVEEDAADWAVERMQEYGFVDDAAYAAMKAQALADRGYGPRRIVQELRRRGIERDLAEQAGADVQREDGQLLQFFTRRFAGARPDGAERQKAWAALYRRGFGTAEIDAAWRQYVETLEEE